MHAWPGIDSLYSEYLPPGTVHPHDRPGAKPCGMRGLPIPDGDGIVLIFAALLASGA